MISPELHSSWEVGVGQGGGAEVKILEREGYGVQLR